MIFSSRHPHRLIIRHLTRILRTSVDESLFLPFLSPSHHPDPLSAPSSCKPPPIHAPDAWDAVGFETNRCQISETGSAWPGHRSLTPTCGYEPGGLPEWPVGHLQYRSDPRRGRRLLAYHHESVAAAFWQHVRSVTARRHVAGRVQCVYSPPVRDPRQPHKAPVRKVLRPKSNPTLLPVPERCGRPSSTMHEKKRTYHPTNPA